MNRWKGTLSLLLAGMGAVGYGQSQLPVSQTFSQKLGWKQHDKVIMFHVDDAGMSYESNQGAFRAITKGIATSVSVMMPCPWVPAAVAYFRQHPQLDVGVHLTLTAEWEPYRWQPLLTTAVPGLMDNQGAYWSTVADVINHASAKEVDDEIRAQVARARAMGLNPSHLDTHMGTLWSSPDYLERYVALGIAERIPILFAKSDNPFLRNYTANQLETVAQRLWNNGLPVVDYIHLSSYDWLQPSQKTMSDSQVKKYKLAKFKELIRNAKPGITVVLIHCTAVSPHFSRITNSGNTRKADLLVMLDPSFKKFLNQQGVILTTWRELSQRRAQTGALSNR